MATPLTEYTPITEAPAKDIVRVARGLEPFDERTRYELNFHSVSSGTFEKSQHELLVYKADLTKIKDNIVEYYLKDIQDSIEADILRDMQDEVRRMEGAPFPMTPFDNLAAGLPMRGCPIDMRGLR